jgi:uncharacterized protein (TIGR03083 family)
MNPTIQTPASQAVPRPSALDRKVAMRLASTEYDRFAAVLDGLAASDWTQPTDCPAWDVRAMASHVLGMAEGSASIREGNRQRRAAMRRGGVFIDALTDLQVEERSTLAPAEIARQFTAVGPRAARGRRRTPRFIRRRRLPIAQQVGDVLEWWTLGYLVDVVLTRDVWMHRVDITRATGRPMQLTADHDGLIVADIVAEWAQRHDRPCTLRLTGPAGGNWSSGAGGPHIELDAGEFCRTVSGRQNGDGLLNVAVPF